MAARKSITQERLREVLDYDPETGLFTWKLTLSNRGRMGNVAGWPTNGYILIRIDGIAHFAHRLAWLYLYGELPHEVDHINTIRNDNRIINLRPCTRGQNACNRNRQKNNKSGFKGVSWDKKTGKWVAQIKAKRHVIGYYTNIQEAADAYALSASRLHGAFARF